MGYSEEDVIKSVVKKISDCGYGRYQITQWPDKNQNNRNSPEIDAIAEAVENPPLAIEHTRVESFVGQLMDDNRVKSIYYDALKSCYYNKISHVKQPSTDPE